MADKTTATRVPNPPVHFTTPTPPAGGYKPPAQAFQGPAGQQAAPTGDTSAIQTLMDMLSSTGLGSLAQQAWSQWLNGTPLPVITQWVRSTPEYAAIYPGLNDMRTSGGLINTEAAYNDYVNRAQQVLHAAGLPAEFGSRAYLAQRMLAGMGLGEFQQRVQDAANVANNIPQAARDFAAQNYGWDVGHLAGMFLDPNVAEPVLARQAQAAQIGGAGHTAGYDVTGQEALHLSDLGVTQSQAANTFGTLAHDQQLFNPLPGENAQAIGREQQLAAGFENNAAAQDAIQRAQERRLSAFSGGGGFVRSSSGFSGVGPARSA